MTRPDLNGIPVLGLGTFGRTGPEGLAAILEALEAGYRHIDTAQSYGTEANVGEAIRRSGLPRDEVFVTTKIADTHLDSPRALESVARSLETMGLDRIDLLLIHWPSQNDQVPFENYMTALAEAQDRGWARLIGVSNFTIRHLDRAEALLGPGRLATNQVEIHPYLQTPRLAAFAKAKGLPLTAYQPLAKGEVARDPTLSRIGKAHDVSAAAVALAFLMAQGHIVIPASSDPARLRGNLEALTVSLSEDELAQIRALDRGQRLINPDKAPDWDDR
ncbi:aldo/keto reductase [Rubellimicrobium rubrum]|uniref:Aldo/keto reductase n=1 Tax=Rubellimicrobium rubrum TaxID=2585369 RepID=A0A5C4N5K9_9RHOB|nr:aldo/keto reductase [Rubellimicrobium rubrum]TNC51638.1 aldo/keto reductase [Rubellimicrobium rubrum]